VHHASLDFHHVDRWQAGFRLEQRVEQVLLVDDAAVVVDLQRTDARLPHQELNASATEELHCALVRSGTEELVVNIDVDAVAKPEWIDA
jgi:uncharacterized RmlC-like cupin family protein